MADPTYVMEEIDKKPTWKIAFLISEVLNDFAPIGWGEYIYLAEVLQENFTILAHNPDTGAVGPVEKWMARYLSGDMSAAPEEFQAKDDEGFFAAAEGAIATAFQRILGGQDE